MNKSGGYVYPEFAGSATMGQMPLPQRPAALLLSLLAISLPATSAGAGSGPTPPLALMSHFLFGPVDVQPARPGGGPKRTSGGVTSSATITPTSTTDAATWTTPGVAVSGLDALTRLPQNGDYELRVLTPTLLELRRVLPKTSGAPFAAWNFVDSSGNYTAPAAGKFKLTGVRKAAVTSVDFKRISSFGQLWVPDQRVEASLYLTLSSPVNGGSVQVSNPDGTLWPSGMKFVASDDPLRFNPAIHVNQEGYVPSFSKKAMIGYYLGSGGELPIAASSGFTLVNAATGAAVYTGTLTHRIETGYEVTPLPYQQVYEADFSSFTTPGQYRLAVPGMGASAPFLIDDGIAMGFARTYALGVYHQRCGGTNELPFTRFTHAACHTDPAEVPTADAQYAFTWQTIANYSGGNASQMAPQLVSAATQLYPFVNQGSVDVAGGHHDAGDYSKYTTNSAALAHALLFAADNIPGAASLDNLGIPESGDGISDLLQEGKWEADYLAKLQDADGGFYFIVYPKYREYEMDVSPENGDTQVVWPKNTVATAAAVAVLAEYASSPLFKARYPAAAAAYLAKATAGWQFLINAIAAHGKAGAYQKITFYGDEYMHDDELAWAAAAMYTATGDAAYQQKLFEWFPDPASPDTIHWTWQRMYQGWGCAIRNYAFAARSGRLAAAALDAAYLAACEGQVVASGDDALYWTTSSAYGTSFPVNTRHFMQAGWFFSVDNAAEMAVAYQVSPKQAYIDALVTNVNYESGCNPVNVSFVAGLGLRRPTQMVSQYRMNNRHILPPVGQPMSNVQSDFSYVPVYGSDLPGVAFPAYGISPRYWLQDRFTDVWNVTTEFVTAAQGRALISSVFLGTRTASRLNAWTPATSAARIAVPANPVSLKKAVTLSLSLNGVDVSNARITWEARDQLPVFGQTYTITPRNSGVQWVEAEIAYPDGRRVFLTDTFAVK